MDMSTILFVYISVEFRIPAVGRCQRTLLLFIGNSNPLFTAAQQLFPVLKEGGPKQLGPPI